MDAKPRKRRLADGNGRPVPKRLFGVFSARETVIGYLDELQSWSSKLKNRKEVFQRVGIEIPNVRRLLLAMQYAILDGLPYIICACDGNPDCKRCGGKGWLTKNDISATGLFVCPDDLSAEPPPTTTSPSDAS